VEQPSLLRPCLRLSVVRGVAWRRRAGRLGALKRAASPLAASPLLPSCVYRWRSELPAARCAVLKPAHDMVIVRSGLSPLSPDTWQARTVKDMLIFDESNTVSTQGSVKAKARASMCPGRAQACVEGARTRVSRCQKPLTGLTARLLVPVSVRTLRSQCRAVAKAKSERSRPHDAKHSRHGDNLIEPKRWPTARVCGDGLCARNANSSV
jgi:hypothetical protein